MLYYLDACIWIDYLEDRRDKFRPLGEWACRLINQILDSDDYFMLTDILFDELKKHLSDNRLSELAQLVPKKTRVFIQFNKEDIRNAQNYKKRYRLYGGDALHLALAKRMGAVWITRDKHFMQMDMPVQIFKPEDLL